MRERHRIHQRQCADNEDNGDIVVEGRPLTSVEVGELVRLVSVCGCRNASHRLAELGLTPGVEFEVLRKGNGGPLLLAVRDSRLALGRNIAQRVMVAETNNGGSTEPGL